MLIREDAGQRPPSPDDLPGHRSAATTIKETAPEGSRLGGMGPEGLGIRTDAAAGAVRSSA